MAGCLFSHTKSAICAQWWGGVRRLAESIRPQKWEALAVIPMDIHFVIC